MELSQPHRDHRSRMRERFRRDGISAFEEHEILEMLLFSVFGRKNTNPLAHDLIESFGDLEGVLSAKEEELLSVDGVGERTTEYLHFLGEVYSRMTCETLSAFPVTNESAAGMYASLTVGSSPAGSAAVAYLDGEGTVITLEWLYRGHGKMSNELCGIISDRVGELGAKGILLMHNHRGRPHDPSPDDLIITESLRHCGIDTVWHVIVSDDGYRHI